MVEWLILCICIGFDVGSLLLQESHARRDFIEIREIEYDL